MRLVRYELDEIFTKQSLQYGTTTNLQGNMLKLMPHFMVFYIKELFKFMS